ncbi:hypothetical protein DXK94_02955 [Arthrobacter sp. RT-1]|nr:hypothetical protein DXK94_02955 [Arthrobacter sp. RT-1]
MFVQGDGHLDVAAHLCRTGPDSVMGAESSVMYSMPAFRRLSERCDGRDGERYCQERFAEAFRIRGTTCRYQRIR